MMEGKLRASKVARRLAKHVRFAFHDLPDPDALSVPGSAAANCFMAGVHLLRGTGHRDLPLSMVCTARPSFEVRQREIDPAVFRGAPVVQRSFRSQMNRVSLKTEIERLALRADH